MSSTEPSLFSRMLGTDDGPLTTSTKSADIRAPSSHQLAPPPAAPSTPHAETTARPPASVIAVPASAGTLKQSTGPRSPVSHPEMCTSPSDIGIWEVSKLDTRESGPAGLFRAVFGGGSQKE